MLENSPVCTNGCMSSFTEFKILIVIHFFSISVCNILHTYFYKSCVIGYTMEKWVTIKIPTDLLIEVGKFLETRGKKLGYPSKTQFISEAIRESLNNAQKTDNNEKILEEMGIMNRKLDDFYEISRKLPYDVHRLLMMFNEGEKPDSKKIKAVKAWMQKSKKTQLEENY